ncbi:hypothetical protein GCM10027277_47850 [Pseudoduganella ginsengisoli]|uniref:O-antigen ligase domain-containing protein n=1 Tax=Pseudoduganella ginsengisoli TaxID=1462440 RepID=A0A6L6Q3F5_9BURK|nr:hypothetical protein [Pseudoduganella ginsengisoli]MTW04026.1 hypothetical protein [Pseudoduganella ginsengisoli]
MMRTASQGRWTGILVSGLFFLTAIFLGLLIGAEQHILTALFLLLVLSLPMFYLAIFGFVDQRGVLLGCGFALMFVSQMLQNRGIPAGYLMEALIFLFMLSSLREAFKVAAADSTLRWIIALFLAYFALSLLSTVMGRSHWRGAVWQLQYNLKWPLMFALGMLMASPDQAQVVLRRFIMWSWLFFLPFLVFELAAPGLFIKLFGYAEDVHVNPLLGFSHRLRGPFSHSGYMALMCGLLASGAAACWLQHLGRRWLVLALIYTAMAISTGQRQELMSLVLVYGLFAVMAGRRHAGWIAMGAIVGVTMLAAALMVMNHNPFDEIMRQWGAGRTSELSERAILTQAGMRIADQYFPLGSGLGTYGGAGAQRFDHSLFLDQGFSRYWWFRQGIFLVDTYWPSVAAETGYPAMFLLLASFMLLWCTLLRRALTVPPAERPLVLTALAAMTLLLANSPTSAIVTDPRGAFVFWLVVGCAWRASMTRRAVSADPVRPVRQMDFSVRYQPS